MSVISSKILTNSDGQSQRSSDSDSDKSPAQGRNNKSNNNSDVSERSHRNSNHMERLEKRHISKSSYSDSDDNSSADDDSVKYSGGSSMSISSTNQRSRSTVKNSARSSSGNKEKSKWSSSKPGPYSKKRLLKEFNSLHRNRSNDIAAEPPESENMRRIISANNQEIRELYSQKSALKAELQILEEENKKLRMDVGHQGKELKNIQPVQDLMLKQWEEIRKLRKRIHRKQVKCSDRDEQIKVVSERLNSTRDKITKNQRLIERKDLRSQDRLEEECFQVQRELDYKNSQIQRLQDEIEKMQKNHLSDMRNLKHIEQQNKSNDQEFKNEIKELQSKIKEAEKRLDISNIYAGKKLPARYHQVSSLSSYHNSGKSSSATNTVLRNGSASKSNVPFLPPLSGASGKQIESESETDLDVSSGSSVSDGEEIRDITFHKDPLSGGYRGHTEQDFERLELNHLEPLPDVRQDENRLDDLQKSEIQRRLRLIDAGADPKSNDVNKTGMGNKFNNRQVEALKRQDSLNGSTDMRFLNKKQPIEAENLPKFGDYQPSFTATGQTRASIQGGGKGRQRDEIGERFTVESKNDTWIQEERDRIKGDSDKQANSKQQRERSLQSMKPNSSSDEDIEDFITL